MQVLIGALFNQQEVYVLPYQYTFMTSYTF